MRWLTGLVVALAVFWGGYWVVGEQQLDKAARSWFAAQSDFGREARYDDISVHGFPSRFDLTITEPRLFDPASGITWQAPFVQILSLSYKPWHVIAALPPEQRFSGPLFDVDLRAKKLQASLMVKPQPSLPLDRTTIAGDDVSVSINEGAETTAQRMVIATRQDPSRPNNHEISIEIKNLHQNSALAAGLSATNFPSEVQDISVSAFAGFSAPLDRFAPDSRPFITELDIRNARLNWGDVALFGQGKLVPDSSGFAEGQIDLRLKNWQLALRGATELGLINSDVAASWENAGRFLASQSADPDQIDVPLQFRNGVISLGVLTIARAPRLR